MNLILKLQKQKKIPNLIYLENNSCVVKGNIKIFGTPISQCRAELYNKCYLSAAFETKKTKREVIYKSIPDELLEAAKLDGTSSWRFFIDFLVPLSKKL